MSSPLELFYSTRSVYKFNSVESEVWLAEYLRYAFAFQSNNGFCKWSTECGVPMDRISLSASSKSNGELLLDIKGFIFATFLNARLEGRDRVDLRVFNVASSDKRWLTRCLWSSRLLQEGLTRLLNEGYTPLDPQRAREMMAEALTSRDVKGFFGAFARRKLTFLQSYGHTMDSLFSFLVENSVYSMLRVFPAWKDTGFLMAVAKNSAKRAGLNLIQSETTQKRQSLIRETNGFSAVNISYELLAESGYDPSAHVASTSVFDVGTIDALRSFVEKSRDLLPHQRSFLGLMMGDYDETFSAFLGQPNDDAVESMPYSSYQKRVATYLGMHELEVSSVMNAVRSAIV